MNLYSYVTNNPTNWLDPFGLAACQGGSGGSKGYGGGGSSPNGGTQSIIDALDKFDKARDQLVLLSKITQSAVVVTFRLSTIDINGNIINDQNGSLIFVHDDVFKRSGPKLFMSGRKAPVRANFKDSIYIGDNRYDLNVKVRVYSVQKYDKRLQ